MVLTGFRNDSKHRVVGSQTHPWRLVNARTGGLVKQLVASGSFSNILVTDADFDSETVMAAPEPADFSGFDGIGGDTSEYASAKVQMLLSLPNGPSVMGCGYEGIERGKPALVFLFCLALSLFSLLFHCPLALSFPLLYHFSLAFLPLPFFCPFISLFPSSISTKQI